MNEPVTKTNSNTINKTPDPSEICPMIFKIYNIFKDYFGEENIDLQGMPEKLTNTSNIPGTVFLYVHFPEITVTNEYEENEIIYDLYTRISIVPDKGIIYNAYNDISSIRMLRTTFTEEQVITGYIHSHLPKAYNSEDFSEFRSPCFGEGPIKTTVYLLSNENKTEEELLPCWELFCFELDNFVKRESLSGGPYIRMSSIYCGKGSYVDKDFELVRSQTTSLSNYILTIFVDHPEEFPFVYNNNQYVIGLSKDELILKISKHVIQSLNEYLEKKKDEINVELKINYLIRNEVIVKVCINDKGKLVYKRESYDTDLSLNTEISPLVFKGQKIYLKQLAPTNGDLNSFYIINPISIVKAYTKLLFFVNSQYGK